MPRRGWTVERIEDTLNNPYDIVSVRDKRYYPSGSRIDDPATVYIRVDGSYVVRNDQTGDIVQISDCHNPDWKLPF
jgi:filamentous hemagglutinin